MKCHMTIYITVSWAPMCWFMAHETSSSAFIPHSASPTAKAHTLGYAVLQLQSLWRASTSNIPLYPGKHSHVKRGAWNLWSLPLTTAYVSITIIPQEIGSHNWLITFLNINSIQDSFSSRFTVRYLNIQKENKQRRIPLSQGLVNIICWSCFLWCASALDRGIYLVCSSLVSESPYNLSSVPSKS